MMISLKAARVNAGMTQKDVAQRLGVTKATIVNWEKHDNRLSFDKLNKLCSLYGIRIDDVRIEGIG